MTERTHRNLPKVGPYSRWLRRGAAAKLDARTPEAKFMRALEHQLAAHLGGEPTIAQKMMISRLARIALRLELLEQKFNKNAFTALDDRVYSALTTQFRMMLRALGLESPTLADGGHRAPVSVDELFAEE